MNLSLIVPSNITSQSQMFQFRNNTFISIQEVVQMPEEASYIHLSFILEALIILVQYFLVMDIYKSE